MKKNKYLVGGLIAFALIVAIFVSTNVKFDLLNAPWSNSNNSENTEEQTKITIKDLEDPYKDISKAEIMEQSVRRNAPDDEQFDKHAKPFIDIFQTKYPDVPIVKIRWQSVLGNFETYIVEGIKDGEKYVVKFLSKDQSILGVVVRELLPTEYDEDGVPNEKPLDLDIIISFTELEEKAKADISGELLDLKITWTKSMPVAEIQTFHENGNITVIRYNAITGERVA